MKHLILVFFSIFLFSTNSFAANKTQLQKWNESPISNVRNQVADQNAGTFSEIPNSQRTIKAIEAKVDTGKVQALIEDKTNYKGSLGKTYVATEIPYSAESAAKTWAGRLGKLRGGAIPAIVGSIAFDQFMKGVGWMMDDGSKAIMKPKPVDLGKTCLSDGSDCKTSQYLYKAVSSYFPSLDSALYANIVKNGIAGTEYSKISSYSYALKSQDSTSVLITVTYRSSSSSNACNTTDCKVDWSFSRILNPKYDSSLKDEYTEVTQQQIEDAIKDYLSRNPKSQISADLLRYAYTLQDPNGNPTDDPKKADPNNNDSPREITNATNDVLKSNDPLSTGKTNTFPTVTYNNVTNNYNETTTNNDTTNNTTNTTTTEGQSQTDIPPACEYFATLCEWMDWTKKDDLPEKEEIDKEEPKIEEKQVPVNWGAQCPPAETITFTLEGQSIDLKIIDFEYICPQAPIISPLVIFSSTISALYIIFGFGNRSSGGSDD